jgi:hypothetical protein
MNIERHSMHKDLFVEAKHALRTELYLSCARKTFNVKKIFSSLMWPFQRNTIPPFSDTVKKLGWGAILNPKLT